MRENLIKPHGGDYVSLRKILILIMTGCICIVICINTYLLFIYNPGSSNIGRSPQRPAPQTAEERVYPSPAADSDPAEIIEHPSIESMEQQAESLRIEVKEVPIPLEADIDMHLRDFRRQAKTLQSEFPDSFIISNPTAGKLAALTFDDGPDRETTGKIVEVLDGYGIPGTFFFIGRQISKFEQVFEAVHSSGHGTGNHSWSHLRPTDLTIHSLLDEVETAQAVLDDKTDMIKLYRPPYGLVTREQMALLAESGYTVVAWSVDSMDWYFDNPDDIAKCVIEAIHPGAIILMHSAGGKDNRNATVMALPKIIENLKAQGYKFVTVNELMNKNR